MKAAKTPTTGKPAGKPPKPEHKDAIVKTNKQIAVVMAERGGRDLIDVLREVDDCFLRAAECGENVSRLLETKRTYYHSTFSNNLRGIILGEILGDWSTLTDKREKYIFLSFPFCFCFCCLVCEITF